MKLRLVIVGLFFALVLAYTTSSYYTWLDTQHMLVERGWNGWPDEPGGPELVQQIMPNGPAAALLVGDEIIRINGHDVERSDYKTENAFRPVKPGDTYTITIRRAGQQQEFTLRRERGHFVRWVVTSGNITSLLAFVVFFLIGCAVFALKPEDKQALLLSLFLVLFASAFAAPQPAAGQAWWYSALIVFGQVTKRLCPLLLLHLFLVFPEPSPLLRRVPRLERYIYLPLLLSVPVMTYSMMLWTVAPDEYFNFWLRHAWLGRTMNIIEVTCVGCALLALVVSYRKAGQVGRRKLRIAVVGSLAAIVPLATWTTCLQLIPGLRAYPEFRSIMWAVVNTLALLLPLSFAYAIVRHQVIPVRLIIRRGVQYLLARNALRLLLALPLIALALSVLRNPHRTLADLLLRNDAYFYLLLVVTVALGLGFRRRLGEWIDRKFFRESYNQEKILHALVDDVKRLDSIPEMSKRVTDQVNAALHPEQVYLFYRGDGQRDLSLSYTSGGATHELRIPEEFQLLRLMELHGGAEDFPFAPKINLPQLEKDWLAQLNTRLIVPLTGTDARLSGLLLLGAKKSEVPYTTNDRELLETLAGQIAIVYENVRLKSHVDKERRIKHEVLARVAGQNINVLKECPHCGACFDMDAHSCPHDDAELTLTLPVERTIEGRYRLDRLLGRGGMGAVYEATDLRLQRQVAVKILTGNLFGNSEALRRFEREARTSARLQHEHIVTIHDYGLLNTEGAYLVMELVRGETLGARLKREGQLAPAVAADLFDQMLAGVGAAHDAGVVHRDLKPENILLEQQEDGRVCVHILDFGLAKLTQTVGVDSQSPTAPPVTTPGAVVGTFGYMSPEQLTGGMVDERSDFFSLGVMIVEAVTGRRPFTGATYHELLTNILQGTYHLPDESPAAQQLDQVLQRCLAKDPEARFASVVELQRALGPALRQCPHIAAHPPVRPDADTFILH